MKTQEPKTGQHTPGPWTYYGDDMVAKNGELIAQALRGGSRQLPLQSNRALIAAAPELLATLENTLKMIEFIVLQGPPEMEPKVERTLAAARAAIAKAKGQ